MQSDIDLDCTECDFMTCTYGSLAQLLVPGVGVDPNVVKQRLGHAIVEDFVKYIVDE